MERPFGPAKEVEGFLQQLMIACRLTSFYEEAVKLNFHGTVLHLLLHSDDGNVKAVLGSMDDLPKRLEPGHRLSSSATSSARAAETAGIARKTAVNRVSQLYSFLLKEARGALSRYKSILRQDERTQFILCSPSWAIEGDVNQYRFRRLGLIVQAVHASIANIGALFPILYGDFAAFLDKALELIFRERSLGDEVLLHVVDAIEAWEGLLAEVLITQREGQMYPLLHELVGSTSMDSVAHVISAAVGASAIRAVDATLSATAAAESGHAAESLESRLSLLPSHLSLCEELLRATNRLKNPAGTTQKRQRQGIVPEDEDRSDEESAVVAEGEPDILSEDTMDADLCVIEQVVWEAAKHIYHEAVSAARSVEEECRSRPHSAGLFRRTVPVVHERMATINSLMEEAIEATVSCFRVRESDCPDLSQLIVQEESFFGNEVRTMLNDSLASFNEQCSLIFSQGVWSPVSERQRALQPSFCQDLMNLSSQFIQQKAGKGLRLATLNGETVDDVVREHVLETLKTALKRLAKWDPEPDSYVRIDVSQVRLSNMGKKR